MKTLQQQPGSFLLTPDGNFSHPKILRILGIMITKQTKQEEIIKKSKIFFESIGFETVISNNLLSMRNVTNNKSISIQFNEGPVKKFIGNCKTKLRLKFRYVNYWFDQDNKLVPITQTTVKKYLQRCPHCNSQPYAYLNAPSSDQQPWVHVACLKCGSGSPTIETWNRREGKINAQKVCMEGYSSNTSSYSYT